MAAPKRSSKRSYDSYGKYIHAVLGQVDPAYQISSDSIDVMDDIIKGVLAEMHDAMHSAMTLTKVQTLMVPAVEAAVLLVLPGKIKENAVDVGRNAVVTFTKAPAGTKGDTVSRSQRANLQFSISRVENALSDLHFPRISSRAAVYTAAVLEYITAEILELSRNATRDGKRQRIMPRHITLAITNDEELRQIVKKDTIASGGVRPYIAPVLLPKKKESRRISASEKEAPPKKKAAPRKKASPKKK